MAKFDNLGQLKPVVPQMGPKVPNAPVPPTVPDPAAGLQKQVGQIHGATGGAFQPPTGLPPSGGSPLKPVQNFGQSPTRQLPTSPPAAPPPPGGFVTGQPPPTIGAPMDVLKQLGVQFPAGAQSTADPKTLANLKQMLAAQQAKLPPTAGTVGTYRGGPGSPGYAPPGWVPKTETTAEAFAGTGVEPSTGKAFGSWYDHKSPLRIDPNTGKTLPGGWLWNPTTASLTRS